MHFFLKQRQKPQKTAQKKGQQSTGPNNMFFFRKKVRSASNQHWPPTLMSQGIMRKTRIPILVLERSRYLNRGLPSSMTFPPDMEASSR